MRRSLAGQRSAGAHRQLTSVSLRGEEGAKAASPLIFRPAVTHDLASPDPSHASSMVSRLLGFLLLLGFAPAPATAQFQLPLPVSVEGRIGYAFPLGDFASADGPGAEGGLSFALGGRVDASPIVAIIGSYSRTGFRCAECAARQLDDRMILQGAELGVRMSARRAFSGAIPWAQGGLLYQTLAFASPGDRMTSAGALGFSASAGVALSVGTNVEFIPAVRYLVVPTSFDFSFAPDRSIDVTGVALDIGVALRP